MITHPKTPWNCICSLYNAHTALDAGISRGLQIPSDKTEKGEIGRKLYVKNGGKKTLVATRREVDFLHGTLPVHGNKTHPLFLCILCKIR